MKLNKRQKNTLTWLLIWAGLLIAVLYSPVGSPDLYTSKNYYVENRSVSLQSGTIQNASKIKPATENTDNDPGIPDISTVSKPNYAVGNYTSSKYISQGSSYGGSLSQTYLNNNTGSGGGSGGGTTILANSGSHNSAGISGVIMTNNLPSTSITSNLNSPNKQFVTATTTTISIGGTDPGGDPDLASQIPVGDGWWLLVLFGAVYIFIKRKLS